MFSLRSRFAIRFVVLTISCSFGGVAFANSPLDTTRSLTPAFLAGRIVHPGTPDGIGTGAYLNQPGALTGCRNQIYFTDLNGLRALDLTSRQVTTLIPAFNNFYSLWCDGKFLYTSSTSNDGRLTIEQTNLDTLQKSSFSYPATGSYSLGTIESVFGVGTTLYTTDSAAGRIWQIDLNTHDRSVVVDFGGPLISVPCLHVPGGSPSTAIPVGRFWTDGSMLYILRPQPRPDQPPSCGTSKTLTSINIGSGQTAALASGYFGAIFGDGSSLYLLGADVQRFDLNTEQTTTLLSADAVTAAGIGALGGIWGSNSTLYFMVLFPEGAIETLDGATGNTTLLAGDLYRDLDGAGSAADFGVYLLPADMKIWGDSNALYIFDVHGIRRYDLKTQVVSTLMTTLAPAKALWTDGVFLYFGQNDSIGRIELATKKIITITTDVPFHEVEEIWGDGTSLYINDYYSAIRKLELASGKVTTLLAGDGIYRGIWGLGRSLYFCDTREIRRLDLDTLATETIAGGGGEGSLDGIGTDALFSRADGIWGDGANLFVVDAMRTIRRVDMTTRLVTTIYGSAEPLSQGIFGDGLHLYLMEGFSLRRYDPVASLLAFSAPGQGLSITDLSPASSLAVVHGQTSFSGGAGAASGVAIWGYRNPSGVLVSEAAVPAQNAIQSGRIYAQVGGSTNTGIAISNPRNSPIQVSFYFTGADGTDFGNGSFILGANQEVSRFLNEAPFSGGSSINGTFTFSASAPVAALAIRGLTNERSDFLMTTLPVVDLNAPVSTDPHTIAHFATGGGWTTQILLVNPTDQPLAGTLQFFSDSGQSIAPVPYFISSCSSQSVPAAVPDLTPKGSVLVSPAANNSAPVPLVVFDYAPAGVTVTETGVPSIEGSSFLSYVEATVTPPDQTSSGIAIANPSDQPTKVFLSLANSLGEPFGYSAQIALGPREQAAKFLPELFPTLQLPFTGVMHISSNSSISIAGLRGRYNSRQDFIVATVMPVPNPSTAAPQYFPHLVTGSGYSTRLFLINTSGLGSSGTIQFMNSDGTPAPF